MSSRPRFLLPVDTDDPEDDPQPRHRNPASTDSSDPDSIPFIPLSTSEPESSRHFHALSELLTTELGYLLDLRTLVSVYLRLLPVLKNRSSLPPPYSTSSSATISYFSRPPSLHPSVRTQSHPHLGGGAYVLSSAQPAETLPFRSASLHPVPVAVEKCTTRHLFSASDLDTITRNAEDILDFHERLVQQLRQVVSPFGITMTTSNVSSAQPSRNSLVDIRSAIDAVSTVFINNVSSFHQYQSFCSGHSEAFDLVRKVQHRYPSEWDAFELRCATVATDMRSQDVDDEPIPSSESRKSSTYKRRHSFSSVDALSSDSSRAPIVSASESGHADRNTNMRRPRLTFMDYMIKPVQRVTRYPLLFDQLQARAVPLNFKDSLNDTPDSVKTALWTMRTVARLVDEARKQQDLLAKSVQIVSRITQGLLTSAASHDRASQSASLSTFLSSLAPCHLSGSLDVIHYRGASMARLGTVRAKYLGAFLFPGGFLVLVKVSKSKVYEPKHWFNLRAFELVDSNLDDVLLPSWFRLSSKVHMFEFAASCRREKDIWVDAIRRAIAEDVPWNDEPPSSVQTHFTPSPLDNAQSESISPLPTIQSIPELDNVEPVVPNSGDAVPALVARSPSQSHLHAEKSDVTVAHITGTSRRSSIVVHSTTMPESNTFHLVRSTASAREQVDRGLLDVFSERCLTARFHAHTHEEDLFETQKIARSFSRSTSALTMASAMSVAAKNRLTKRESVFVPRKQSFVDGNGLGDTDNFTTVVYPVVSQSAKRRRHPSTLKIIATTKPTPRDGDEDRNEPALDSPSPMSHCSSVSFATPVTPLATLTPVQAPSGSGPDSLESRADFLNVRQRNCAPKRSKSMIDSVRGFFTPRAVSPTTALSREPSTRSSVSNSSLLKWWSKESLRQKIRSAPDVPIDEIPATLTTMSLYTEAAPEPLIMTTDRPYSQPDLHWLYSQIAGSSTMGFGVDPPRKRGLFSSRGSRRRWTASPLSSERHEDSARGLTRIRRKISFMHRFSNHSTRHYDDTPLHAHGS